MKNKKHYILLDWNIVKYLIEPRPGKPDEEFKELLFKLNKYEFPFCEGHIRDVLPSYTESNKERVISELRFLNHVSKGKALGMDPEENISVVEGDIMALFHMIRNETQEDMSIAPSQNPQTCYKVDMDKLDPKHPLRPMYEKTNGGYDPSNMSDYLREISETIFRDAERYKNFREYTDHLERDIRENNTNPLLYQDQWYCNHLIYHMAPMINSYHIKNEDELALVWKNIAIHWCKMTSSESENLPFGVIFTTAYSLLDFHPLFRETLKENKNTLDNITRDGNMLYYATSAKFFITEDKTMYKKGKFLCKAFDLEVKVLKIGEFLKRFQ